MTQSTVRRESKIPWSEQLMAAGWTAVPFVLLQYQSKLGLDALDLNVVLQIAKYWWQRDRLPFPAVGALAQSMGVSERTIQRRLRDLERRGYLKRLREENKKTNTYSLAGLIEAAEPYAEIELGRRKAKENNPSQE